MPGSTKKTGYPSIDRPWLKYYSEEAIGATLPECTVYEYLWENNKDHPDDIAIIYFSRRISYRELFGRIEEAARAFSALGVGPGEVVTIALPSVPEALYAVYALNRLGAVANMVHPLAGRGELVRYLNEVGSRVAVLFDGACGALGDGLGETEVEHAVVVSAADSLPVGLKALYRLKGGRPRIAGDPKLLSWKQFMKGGRGAVPGYVSKDVDEAAIISHTGGTTGEPKGVMCSDRSINALIWQVGHTLYSNRQEKMLVVLPPFINYSLVNGIFEPLSLGHQVILIPDYKPEKFVEYVVKFKPNHMNTIPPYLEALLGIPEAAATNYSCLKYVYYGGESMSEEAESAINGLLKSGGAERLLGKGLGATEMVSSATLTLEERDANKGVGVPFPRVDCKIVEPGTCEELQYRQEGEICFSGPTLMLGYYGNETATEEVVKVHSDGERWLHTGDLGYVDEDGVVFVTGRIKRIIMTKGRDGQISKLFPDRIEKAVASHPAVRACCVVGVPDEERVNYPKAVVELNEGHAPSSGLGAEIIGSCRGGLPEYMVPEAVEFTEALPRTERGKVDYRAVEEAAKRALRERG